MKNKKGIEVITLIVMAYLCSAFATWEINPANWSGGLRAFLALIIPVVIGAYLLIEYE